MVHEKIRTYDFKDDTLIDHTVELKKRRLNDIIINDIIRGQEKLFSFLSEVLLQYELRFFIRKPLYDKALKVCM